eukprot:5789602-Prymnesium_polylepis.1
MGLAWRYAEAAAQPRWKGVTWGMLPLHTSGIVACTYHLFYNAPAVTWCVTLQAAMTCVGNTTLALACLRLALACGWTWQIGKEDALAALNAVSALVRGADTESEAGAGGAPAASGTAADGGTRSSAQEPAAGAAAVGGVQAL